MTKFEMAALFLQQSMLLAQHPIAWVASTVYFAGCALIGVGLLFMRRAAIALDILMRRAEEDGLALRTLIERTSK